MTGYIERTYRHLVTSKSLVPFRVKIRETDLFIQADRDLKETASNYVFKYRGYLETYLKHNPQFLSSLVPLPDDRFAPSIVRDMLIASRAAGVGPMASVAGAIAQWVGTDLLEESKNVIVENGGDIFICAADDMILKVAVFAGDSPLSYKISLKIRGTDTPVGVCTSSGTVGSSFSLGKADAVSVVSKSATLSDAAATAICNMVHHKTDIEKAIEASKQIEGVEGILIIVQDRMGAWGNIELE